MGLFVVFAGMNIHPAAAATGVNAQMNFQGRLLNAQGATVPDGFYNIQFKIYQDGDGQTAGDTTGSPAGTLKWTETYLNNNTQGVLVKNGFLSVQLGSITSLSSIDFNQDTLWLSMNIAGTNATCSTFAACSPDGEMTPMKRLSANAYALNSQQLGGLSSSQFLQLGQGAQTDASTNSSIFVNKTSTGNLLQLQNGGVDAFTINNSGNATFGANANHTLSVATAGAATAGLNLTVSAGAAGSGGTALAGGTLTLQGGAGGGTNGNGGDVIVDGGVKNGTGSNGAVNIGTTNASAVTISRTGIATTINGSLTVNQVSTFNDNVTVAAGKSVSLTGGNTASRPASPTEGMLYYDTSTKQLLVYANGKWQADRSASTLIVGTSANGGTSSAVASNAPDGADYVNASTTSAQTTINSALSALATSGGTVYLMEGTYIIDGSISIPNNVTLTGAGNGTIIKLKNSVSAAIEMITNTDTSTGTGVTISNLSIDGNKANQTAGIQDGVFLSGMGATTPRTGAKVTGLQVSNVRTRGIYLLSSFLTSVTNNTVTNSSSAGINLNSSAQDTIQDNIIQNSVIGILVGTSVNNSVFSDNVVAGNSTYGIDLDNTSNNNVVSLNTVRNNGGSANNNGIFALTSSTNVITNNNISDTSATTTNYAINISDSGSSTNLLTANSLGGGSINDIGTGTVYTGQQNSSGYFIFNSASARLGIGNVNPSYMLDVSGDINTTTGYRINGTAGSTTTCSSGQYLNTQVVQGGIITGGSCAAISGGTTLQNVYDNSATTPIIGLTSTGKGIFIRDASTTVGGNLFAIQNNAGTTSYLAVTTSGASVAGTLSATGTITASNGFTLTTGALNLTSTSGALALAGLGASSISTGANALTFTSSNINTTATGINSTAIGATTASTGAFTTLSASGLVTASNGLTLTTGALNLTSTSGALALAGLGASSINTGANALTVTATNFNTTATGINGTAIGATTASTGAFTTLSASGLITASNGLTLTTGALNLTSTSGAIALSGLSASSISTGANALTFTSSNFNTTATGINGTAIGATTAAAGTFTGVTTPSVTSTAALSITGGTTVAVSSTGANSASFDSGTTGAVNIGTGANAKVVTVGSTNTTSSTIIQSGSNGISLSGNTTVTGTLSGSSTINATTGYKFNGTAGSTTTCSAGQFFNSQVVQGGITTSGSCAAVNGQTTLQNAYDNSVASPIIGLTSTGHGLFIRDASTTVGGNLFAIQNNAGTTSYLAVTTSGASVAGTLSATGLITASNGFTLTTGALNLTATSGALAVSGLGASSISTGANALTVTSSNFNTTATGINGTAIGATTASTGAFTTLTVSGLATASNGLTLTTGALNLTGTSGALTLSGLSASSISTGANALTVTSSNFNTTATGINSTAIGATTASTGAFTTVTASGTIVGSSTVQGTQLISTVATGTAPLTVASTTKVVNLNADLLDGLDSTAFLQTESDTLATVTGRGATTSTASSFNGGLTAGNGFTLTTGALNLTSTSGAIALAGLSASSISTGANALTITSSNFNTTATGINGTAIGATTAAAGTFTGITTPTIASTAGLGITAGTTITVSSTGANTASFDSGTTGAVNIGTGANAKVVTVGSINTTSSTIIQSGSAGITLTGNTSLTGTLSVSSTINAVSGYKFNGTSGASTTCSSGQYLQQQVVQGGITTGGTCTTVSPTTTLQQAYDNSGASPIITLSSTGHGLFLKDASTTVGGNLFAVQNNAGSTSYLAVTTSGASVAGTFSATGTVTATGGLIAPTLTLGTSSSANGTLAFKNSTDTNTITLNSTSSSSSYTLTLPTTAPAGGLCIETSSGNATQLVFASCANNNTSIQQVNAWDANNTNTLTISPATVGNEIVFTTQIPTSGVTVTGVSGGGVTSWNKVVTSAGNGTVNRVEMWVGTVTASGSSTITVTYSAAPGAEEITATEFTAAGVNAATSWGIESSSSQLNSTASSTVTMPSRTAVNGSELYVGYGQVQNPPATAGSTSGFVYRVTSTQHNILTYNTALAANTTYQPTANQNTSGQSNTVAVVLTAFVTSTSINNTTSLQNANFYVQAASVGSVAGVLQAASSGTADILNLRNSTGTNVLTVSSAGNVLVKPAASTTAFQVQNASGQGVLTVDTSNSQLVLGTSSSLGGKLVFADAGDTNTIGLAAPLTVAASYTLLLPSNSPTAGLCLATSPSNANQLVFSSCATQVSAASISYVNRWGNTGTSVTTIADAPSSKGNLVVFYSHATNNVSITGISGGGVTNWTKVTGNANTTGQGNNEMWRGVVATAGSATITVTYSAAAGVNDIEAQEFTMGSSTGTWAIDTSGTAISAVSGTTVNFPNLTPLNSSELYTGYAWGGGTMSAGSTSGFTYQTTSASKYLAFNPSVVGGTAYQPTATQTSAAWNSIGAIIAAYTGTSVIVNSTAVQQANFDVQAAQAGTVAGVLQGASTGTADIFQAQNAAGVNVAAISPIAPGSGVFNAGLTLGTPGSLGGQINFAASGNSNVVSILAPTSPGASYRLILPTTTPAPGQCLASSPSNAEQLVFSSCANQVTSIAISNVNTWKSSTVSLTATLGVSPANLGDLMTLAIFASKSNTITSVSGGGVTAWSRIIGANSEELWRGVVTSTGASTITVTVSTPSGPTVELAAQEWTTGSATGSWVIDTSGTISNASSTTVTYPTLTPQSTKDLYIGYAIGGSTMSAGSTSGFTYLTGASASNMGAYNTSTSTTVTPTATQSGSNTSIAVAALIAAYSSSSVISNSTNTQQANLNVQAATPGSVAGVLQAFFTGTGDIFELLDGAGTQVGSTSSTGNVLIQPSTASAAAFQVQTPGGTNVLSTDTSSKLVVIGAGSAGEASPSLLVLDNETGTSADPTVMNGAMYYNATTHAFRCGVAGSWQSCTGLLYSNTSASSSNSNCSNNCAAFSTAAAIPANYCEPGRAIKLMAAGYFSSVATPSQLQFGVYYGTSSSSAASDTLLGTLPPTASVTSASNNYFEMNFNVVCFSTSSMQSSGILDIQTGASSAGMTALPMNSTSGTSVSSNTAKNLYIFPIWDTANSGNTATMTQFTVNGS